jgi:hypothetical protein
MSLLTLASVAAARDWAGAGQRVAKDPTVPKMRAIAGAEDSATQPAAGQPDGGGEAPAGRVASFGELLVAQIPSEPLLAYTTLLALFTASGVSYNAGRWGLYSAAIVVCAAAVLGNYFAQRDYGFADTATAPTPTAASARTQVAALGKLHLPYLPVLTAVLSMAVYGLTVPGSPLQYEVSGTAFAIYSGCLAVGGGVMMSIFAPFLGKGNGAEARPKQASSAKREN